MDIDFLMLRGAGWRAPSPPYFTVAALAITSLMLIDRESESVIVCLVLLYCLLL